MLNKEAQDLPKATLSFNVTTRRYELDQVVRKSDFYICQYFNNNTIYDLTIMDNSGVRQTIKRKKERLGKQVLQIVREYRISHTHETDVRNFFDEVSDLDGGVLKAIKEAVSDPDFFKTKGFGPDCLQNATTGFMFSVSYDISQDQLSRELTLDCQELGITISRKTRQAMPANIYYASNTGGSYNPFRKILGDTYSIKRVFANSSKPVKDRYWYFIGDSLVEVEYTNNGGQEDGLYINDYIKSLDIEEVISQQIKYLKFDEASNKNGFFISERDAMLVSNIELITREKKAAMDEREHAMKLEFIEAQHRLNMSKNDFAVAKHVSDLQLIYNNETLERLKHENSVQAHQLDFQAMAGKAELLRLTNTRERTVFNNSVVLEDMQFRNETLKLQGAHLKHGYAMREMERSDILNQATTTSKLLVLESTMIKDIAEDRRRITEDKVKNINLISSGVLSALKLIGK